MRNLLFPIVVLLIVSCQDKETEQTTRIILHAKLDLGYFIYLEKIPFGNEVKIVIDSAIKNTLNDSIVFLIPPGEQRIYQIRVPRNQLVVTVINDASEIAIHADYFSNQFSIENSMASVALKKFDDKRSLMVADMRRLSHSIENLKKIRPEDSRLPGLSKELDEEFTKFQNLPFSCADSIRSPAAFMRVYTMIDFGKDYQGLKVFIKKAAGRFPNYGPIQNLTMEVLDYVRIFEEEYNVGDQLPPVILPDNHDIPVSTNSMIGKVVLIDFWSSWCHQCMQFSEAKKEARKAFPKDKFGIISIAIDSEKEDWKKIIEMEKYDWPQLIDEKMWQGIAVKTLKFDSIPFNFLLSREGRIINKAIQPDSLVSVVSRAIKSN